MTKPRDQSEPAERRLLDRLLAESKLYRSSQSYKELVDFIVKLRNFAPFNAMLLQVQKPGVRFAASAADWRDRFGRWPKEGARPLLILWPFAPVALVYDVEDTGGEPLPADVQTFPAAGDMTRAQLDRCIERVESSHIEVRMMDAGDAKAGSICVVSRPNDDKQPTTYRIMMNQNHALATQFATLAHELAHLFLGHLGADRRLGVHDRPRPEHAEREIEAESVAYLVCMRNGVAPKAQTYLSSFVRSDQTVDYLDLYSIMLAAGQVEAMLGVKEGTSFASIATPQGAPAGGLFEERDR